MHASSMRGLLLALLLLTTGVLAAQDITPQGDPALESPAAHISFPPPVYAHQGPMEIFGTVALPDMTGYGIEVRALDPLVPPEESLAPWLPATLPSQQPVILGALGVWDTRLYPDGMYELRLVVTRAGDLQTTFAVRPIRIANELILPGAVNTGLGGEASSEVGAATPLPTVPAPAATGAVLPDGPFVTSFVDANVRRGDSTAYPTVGSLPNGQSAPAIGISATGSGWYYIRLSNGQTGFIAPSIVSFTGDASLLGAVMPPPLPTAPPPTATAIVPTPTPSETVAPGPTFGPVPVTLVIGPDLYVSEFSLDPATPTQGQPVQVRVGVYNQGNAAAVGNFRVAWYPGEGYASPACEWDIDNLVASGGRVLTCTYAGYPSWYPSINTMVRVDANNTISETNEGNNVFMQAVTVNSP
jgi:hypothetical protein